MTTAAEADTETPGRIEWLELFFDLVVVAAVAVLSEALREDPSYDGLVLFLVSYGALWFAWTSVVMYADVAAELTKVRTVVVSMFLVAVMAATAPGHFEERANAFAVGFLLVRLFAARSSMLTGRVMTSWPLLQFGAFVVPWLASLWVPTPWKYDVWGAALLLELVLVLARGEQGAIDQLRQFEERIEQRQQHGHQRGRAGERHRALPSFHQVDVDPEHLDERLGLFVIIVLGESVAALVLTASQSAWDGHFVATAVASFVLLVTLWLLTFSYGFASAPGVRPGAMAPRFGLPLHLASTLGILLLGVGLAEAVTSPEHLHGLLLWTTCAGLALHAAASAVAGSIEGPQRFWLLSCALPAIVVPLLLGALAAALSDGLASPLLIWLMVLPVAWQLLYSQRHRALQLLNPSTEPQA